MSWHAAKPSVSKVPVWEIDRLYDDSFLKVSSSSSSQSANVLSDPLKLHYEKFQRCQNALGATHHISPNYRKSFQFCLPLAFLFTAPS